MKIWAKIFDKFFSFLLYELFALLKNTWQTGRICLHIDAKSRKNFRIANRESREFIDSISYLKSNIFRSFSFNHEFYRNENFIEFYFACHTCRKVFLISRFLQNWIIFKIENQDTFYSFFDVKIHHWKVNTRCTLLKIIKELISIRFIDDA